MSDQRLPDRSALVEALFDALTEFSGQRKWYGFDLAGALADTVIGLVAPPRTCDDGLHAFPIPGLVASGYIEDRCVLCGKPNEPPGGAS